MIDEPIYAQKYGRGSRPVEIDITKPLELSDGTRVEVRCIREGYFCVDWEEGFRWFNFDGTARFADASYFYPKLNGRTLRNVKEAPKLEADLAARMERLVRRLSEGEGLLHQSKLEDEARAIIAELDGPKTDEEWARVTLLGWHERYNNEQDLAVALIAKGRELERMGIDRQLRKGTKFE